MQKSKQKIKFFVVLQTIIGRLSNKSLLLQYRYLIEGHAYSCRKLKHISKSRLKFSFAGQVWTHQAAAYQPDVWASIIKMPPLRHSCAGRNPSCLHLYSQICRDLVQFFFGSIHIIDRRPGSINATTPQPVLGRHY